MKLLNEAIADEKKASPFYNRLIKKLKKKKDKAIVREIRDQEKKHYKKLIKVRREQK